VEDRHERLGEALVVQHEGVLEEAKEELPPRRQVGGEGRVVPGLEGEGSPEGARGAGGLLEVPPPPGGSDGEGLLPRGEGRVPGRERGDEAVPTSLKKAPETMPSFLALAAASRRARKASRTAETRMAWTGRKARSMRV